MSYDNTESRFMRREDYASLREVLLGTDDSIEVGLSQIGIDPDEFSQRDLNAIRRQLDIEYDDEHDIWVEG